MPLIIQVAVFRPLAGTYSYAVDDEHGNLPAGSLLELPFGKGRCCGISLGLPKDSEKPLDFELKSVSRYFPGEYGLPPDLVELGRWMSGYYLCPIGEVLSSLCCASPLVKENTEIPSGRTLLTAAAPEATRDQAEVIREIRLSQEERPVLIHGITGSGKTEVYLRLVQDSLEQGRSCIFLVPEITLTREMMRKLDHRFSGILVFHSGMTDRERRQSWLRAKSPGPHLAIGARSCLFTPLAKLGLIIVDEEHDPSYKQDSTPRYNARDLAIIRAKICKARVILGSATPSLESYQNAQSGKYLLLKMTKRFARHGLPKVQVVNLREEKRDLKRKGAVLFSRRLIDRARQLLNEGKQIILFLNRRGFSTMIHCTSCGETVKCRHCSVPLTYYKRRNLSLCHHCGFEETPRKTCPVCKAESLYFRGTGTEKVHEWAARLFEGWQIVRIDGSADTPKNIQESLARFMGGEGHILLGTQLISKGLDSPRIQLSAALNADLGLTIPDFRAAERDFQLLTQLAGRPGRGDSPGECIFQTETPDHYAIRHAVHHDYEGFFREECAFRKKLDYPPFARLARFVFSAKTENRLKDGLGGLQELLKSLASEHGVKILGPVPAPLERIRDRFRWHLLAKSPSAASARLTSFLSEALRLFSAVKGVDTMLDRDPQNMM